MRIPIVALLLIAVFAPTGLAQDATGPPRPRLAVRAAPSMAFPPVEVRVTAQIVGGRDLEDFHCPQVEWNWGDGDRSVREADCEPYQPGAEIERHFTARHVYRREGVYDVKVSILRATRPIARASARVNVVSTQGSPF